MRKSVLFVVFISLLVVSCGGSVTSETETPIPVPSPTLVPPSTPGPRDIPPTAQPVKESQALRKVAVLFLVDGSNSLNTCSSELMSVTSELPSFSYRLFATAYLFNSKPMNDSVPTPTPNSPSTNPSLEWPKIGVGYFKGPNDTTPMDVDWLPNIKLKSNNENDYLNSLKKADALLGTISEAEQKIIILVSDGSFSYYNPQTDNKTLDEVRADVGKWVSGHNSNLFMVNLDCKSQAPYSQYALDVDRQQWAAWLGPNNYAFVDNLSEVGMFLQKIIENTLLKDDLTSNNSSWYIRNFEQSFDLPGDTHIFDIKAVLVDGERKIIVQNTDGKSVEFRSEDTAKIVDFSNPTKFCNDYKNNTVAIDNIGKTPEEIFGYYFIQPHGFNESFQYNYMLDNGQKLVNFLGEIATQPQTSWNNKPLRIQLVNNILDPNSPDYDDLVTHSSRCYSVWISIPGSVDETGQISDRRSLIDVRKFSIKDLDNGISEQELADLPPGNHVDNIRLWADLVKFPDDTKGFVSIYHQEIPIQRRFYPEFSNAENPTELAGHFSVSLKYAVSSYYGNQGKLAVYALTQKTKANLEDTCQQHPLFDIPLKSPEWDGWHALPESDKPSFSTIAPSLNGFQVLDVNLERLLGAIATDQASYTNQCGYKKIVIQWIDANDGVDKQRPSLICDLPAKVEDTNPFCYPESYPIVLQ